MGIGSWWKRLMQREDERAIEREVEREHETGEEQRFASVVVMTLAAASWIRPQVLPRRALAVCSLLAGYLALGLAATVRFFSLLSGDFDRAYVYGAYVGIAAGVVLVALGLPLAIEGK